MSENPILWRPDADRVPATAMHRFMQQQGFDDYAALYRWSIEHSASFWEALCRFCAVRFDRPPEKTLTRPDDIMDAGWFAGGELNFAAHLLRERDNAAALVFGDEQGERRELSMGTVGSRVPWMISVGQGTDGKAGSARDSS